MLDLIMCYQKMSRRTCSGQKLIGFQFQSSYELWYQFFPLSLSAFCEFSSVLPLSWALKSKGHSWSIWQNIKAQKKKIEISLGFDLFGFFWCFFFWGLASNGGQWTKNVKIYIYSRAYLKILLMLFTRNVNSDKKPFLHKIPVYSSIIKNKGSKILYL